MATTDVNVCNGALIRLGEETITALSDANKRAEACNSLYTDTVNEVLRAHPWNFAIKRAALVDVAGLINNGRFTTGITNWTDSSESTSSISWDSTDKRLKLTAIYNAATKTSWATQAFTLAETQTVKLKATLKTTDAAEATTDNYIAIGTTATGLESGQTFFSSLNAGTEATLTLTLTAGTYYVTIGTECNVAAATYVTEIDDISLVNTNTISDNFDFDNKFTLPTDFLRMLDTNMDVEEFRMEGGYLVADVSEIRIQYIAKITDVTLFDQLFVEALELKLAAKLCYHLIDSETRVSALEGLYKMKITEARNIDAQEGTANKMPSGRWLDARFGTGF